MIPGRLATMAGEESRIVVMLYNQSDKHVNICCIVTEMTGRMRRSFRIQSTW